MAKPICVHCGKPYGSRRLTEEKVKHREGEPTPPYRGNGIVVKERSWKTGTGTGRTGSFANGPSIDFGPGEVIVYRSIWDGETYAGGCKPFCTNRCAISYARKAYLAHQLNNQGD